MKNKLQPLASVLVGMMFLFGFLAVDMSHAHGGKGISSERHLRPNADKIVQD